jgi:hypothetical protein
MIITDTEVGPELVVRGYNGVQPWEMEELGRIHKAGASDGEKGTLSTPTPSR